MHSALASIFCGFCVDRALDYYTRSFEWRMQVIGPNDVSVPTHFFKAVLMEKGDR